MTQATYTFCGNHTSSGSTSSTKIERRSLHEDGLEGGYQEKQEIREF